MSVGAVSVKKKKSQMGDLQARFNKTQATAAVLAKPDMASMVLQGQPVAPYARASALWILFFFFQAEDGIRARDVTGVQTCALPIFTDSAPARSSLPRALWRGRSAV